MTELHTQTPWRIGRYLPGRGDDHRIESVTPYQVVVDTPSGVPYVIAECNWHYSVKDALENARRIVACVNACSGISTEDLEQDDGLARHMAQRAYITSMQAAQGKGFDMALEGGACRILAESFAGQFKGAGAVNSLEVGFYHPETGPLTVTVQRVQGKTPAQQRHEAELLRDELLAALEAAVECGMVPKTSAREGGASSYGQAPAVADMIRDAIAKTRKAKGQCYYAPDGTLMSPDGTRSIFDDVDK